MWQVIADQLAQYPLATLGFVILAAFATAIFHAVSGFAGGLLLSILLAPILGVKAVVPVVSIALIISNSSRLYFFRKAIDWPVYRAIIVTALPGIVIGALLYVYLPVFAIAILLGIFLILSIPLRRSLKKRNFVVGLPGLSIVGGGFGLVSGTVIGAGMLLGPFLLGAGVVGEGLVAMIAAIGFTVNITKSLVFGQAEVLSSNLLLTGIMVGLWTIPGAYTGRWIVRKTAVKLHTLLVEGMILSGGCYFIYQGVNA